MRHPGFSFVERRSLPTSKKALSACVREYATFLRSEAGIEGDPPVDLDAIYERFGLRVHAMTGRGGDIQGAALREAGYVFINEEDRRTRRRFSLAHELMEFLVGVLSDNRLGRGVRPYVTEGEKKERLCEWGAGLLLMPDEIFVPDLRKRGATLEGASRLAQRYRTSLLATLTRMVRCAGGRLALIVWKRCHKPAERSAVATENQQSLFGDSYRAAPTKRLRVWWSVFGGRRKKNPLVSPYKSISADSLICRAFEEDRPLRGTEYVSLQRLRGECRIEARPAQIGTERSVITLLRLPDELSQPGTGKDATLRWS